ncbi:MAG: hypothetical protein IPJ06_19940 [Saprospiraceae bacterium]|nr:hypothetical protein [Saprospiraceae bacterium]
MTMTTSPCLTNSPETYLAAARNTRMLFSDRSVGQNVHDASQLPLHRTPLAQSGTSLGQTGLHPTLNGIGKPSTRMTGMPVWSPIGAVDSRLIRSVMTGKQPDLCPQIWVVEGIDPVISFKPLARLS